jgi:hypothetical protein
MLCFILREQGNSKFQKTQRSLRKRVGAGGCCCGGGGIE